MVTDELRAFRTELARPSYRAEARARARLEALIAAEATSGRAPERLRVRRRTAVCALAGAILVSGLAGAATGLLRQELGSSGPPRVEARGGAADATVGRFRSEQPDGLLAALPSLEGKDAGMRPSSDRGGWSECGSSECYLSS
jgi:hypothetical protein